MTEEVTDAIRIVPDARLPFDLRIVLNGRCVAKVYGVNAKSDHEMAQRFADSLAMRSASNSPTTNGEVSEPLDDAEVERLAQLNPIYEGFKEQSVGLNIRTHVRAIAANLAMRAASDDVERAYDAGSRDALYCAQTGQWSSTMRADSLAGHTPTTASAVDDPETAKGGE